MSVSTSKNDRMVVYQAALRRLIPEDFPTTPRLLDLLDEVICVLQAEMEFRKILEATELVWNWGCEIRNETAMNLDAEERDKRVVSDVGWCMDEIYWEMNSAFVAISERRNLARKAINAMDGIRKKIIQDIARDIASAAHRFFFDVVPIFSNPLCPEIAAIQDSSTAELIALRAEVYDNPAWDVEVALTPEGVGAHDCMREIMKYRYMLSFGEHFANYHESLRK